MTQKWRVEYTHELESGWRIFAGNGYEEINSDDVAYVIELLEAARRADFLEWQIEHIAQCAELECATEMARAALKKIDEERALINEQLN